MGDAPNIPGAGGHYWPCALFYTGNWSKRDTDGASWPMKPCTCGRGAKVVY